MGEQINIDLSNLKNAINERFYPYLKNKTRYEVQYGGAGSGKSIYVGQKLLLRILVGMRTGVTHKFLCLRKTAPAARKSIFAQFRGLISDWNVQSLVNVNKVDMTFDFKYGSEVIVGGLDDPEKLKSIYNVTGAWLEEATEMNLDDFRQVDLRIRGKTKSYKQIMVSFNPISKLYWPYREFFEHKKDNSTVVHSTYKDNRFLDEDYVQTLVDLETQDPVYYNIYTLGEWGSLEHVIYSNYQIIEFPQEDFFKDICYGLDYGYNSPTALTFNGMKDEEYYIKEVIYERKMTHTDVITQLGSLIPLKNRRSRIIYVDSAEPELVKMLNNAGFVAKYADKSVKSGLDFCRRSKLFIDKDSSNLIKEIQSYKYREDRMGNILEEPVKFNDHAMDAMRYGLWTHFGRIRPKASILII